MTAPDQPARRERPHSLLVPHVRRRDTWGWIATRNGCQACAEQHGPDYFRHLNNYAKEPTR